MQIAVLPVVACYFLEHLDIGEFMVTCKETVRVDGKKSESQRPLTVRKISQQGGSNMRSVRRSLRAYYVPTRSSYELKTTTSCSLAAKKRAGSDRKSINVYVGEEFKL